MINAKPPEWAALVFTEFVCAFHTESLIKIIKEMMILVSTVIGYEGLQINVFNTSEYVHVH